MDALPPSLDSPFPDPGRANSPDAPWHDDSDFSPRHSFGFRLWHLKHAWMRRLEATLAPLDLTHMQYVLLRAADHLTRQGERPTQTRLAECLATDRMMVSKVLRLLEAKGLIERVAHPEDSRANHVLLTAPGQATMLRALHLAVAAQDHFFGRLGEDRKAQFGAMLDELLALEGCRAFLPQTVTMTTVSEGDR